MSAQDLNRRDRSAPFSPRVVDGANLDVGSLNLAKSACELWLVRLSEEVSRESKLRDVLSSEELARAARFHFDRDRACFTITRATLRILLGAYTGVDPKEIRFSYSSKGKPLVENCAAAISFNVSHSGDMALLGFSRHNEIGVDIEKIKEDFDIQAIANRFFSEREQISILALPVADRFRAFFQYWTLKESFIKALGDGLSHPLHQFDVSFGAGAPVSLTTRPDPRGAEKWRMYTIDVGNEYAAAVTISSEEERER